MYTFTEQNTVGTDVLDSIFSTAPAPDVIATGPNPLKDTSISKVLDEVGASVTTNTVTPIPEPVTETPVTEKEVLNILDVATTELTPEQQTEGETTTTPVVEETTQGRPKLEKNALIEYMLPKIEAKIFGVPDDYDSKITVEEYLSKLPAKELYTILDSNRELEIQEIKASAPTDFYDALPDAVKDVAEFAFNGGTDWEGFFADKLRTQQIEKLDVNNEDHIPVIVDTYLTEATQFTPDQRRKQIEEWKEHGVLEAKAKEFKAPLDNIQQQKLAQHQQIAQAEQKRQQEIADYYTGNVYKALESNQLAGIKLDKKFTADLQEGLLQVVQGPFSGRPMNRLAALIEDRSFVNPDYEALSLAMWILQDKQGALEKLGLRGANAATEKAVKLIKLGEGIKSPGAVEVATPDRTVRRLPNNKRVLQRSA